MPEPIRNIREEIDCKPTRIKQVAMTETGEIVLRCACLCGCGKDLNLSIAKSEALNMADLIKRIVQHYQAQRN